MAPQDPLIPLRPQFSHMIEKHKDTQRPEPGSERILDYNISDSHFKWKKCNWVDPTVSMTTKKRSLNMSERIRSLYRNIF